MRGEGRRLGFLTRIWAIAWKDILAELRAREMVLSMFLFGFLVILIFNFGIEPGLREMNLVRPGVFWSAFIFAGMLGLNRSFAGEKENDCLQGLLLCPVDRAEIYVGKFLANSVVTLFAAVSMGLKSRDVLLAILLFPVMVPVILAAAKSSGVVLDGSGLGSAGLWLGLLLVYDVVFFSISVVTFEYVVEE